MNPKILIVDDSRLARMAVIRALNSLRSDWPQLEAADATTALELVRREAPEVALVDFNMPGRDGLLLVADLLQINPRMHVAIISANHQVEVIARAHAVGAAFLPKPLTDQALADFLDSVITSHPGS